MLETGGTVHADRGGIGRIADDRDHLPEAACGRLRNQRIEQLAADAHAFHGRIDVNGILDRCAIGRAGAIGAGIGISGYLSADIGDEIGIVALHQKATALGHRLHRWRIDLEAGAAMKHGVPVNFGYGWNIRLFTGADGKAGNGGKGHSLVLRIIHAIIVHCGAAKIKIICLIQTIRFSLMMDLDLRQVRSFMDVADLGSFSAAADKAGLTQPAISLHIRLLEKQLGVRLIERVGRRAQPTAAGRDFLIHARRIAEEVAHAIDTVAPHRSGVTGRLRIGTGATACIYLLPPVLGRIRQAMPGIEIIVQTGNTADILRLLEANTIDAAVVALPASGRSLDIRDIHLDELVAVFPHGAVPDATALTAETLSTRQLLLYEGGNTRRLVDQWFSTNGRTVQPAMELGSVEAIKKLAGAGLGLAIVPRMAMEHEGAASGLEWRSLVPPLERRIALAMRRDKHMTAPLRALAAALPDLRKR